VVNALLYTAAIPHGDLQVIANFTLKLFKLVHGKVERPMANINV
jgi:hypothetical protein